MKRIALALALLAGSAQAQEPVDRFYDRSGSYRGHSERSAGTGYTRHYDRQGRYIGQSRPTTQGTERFYGRDGSYQGQSRPPSAQRPPR